MAQIGLRVYDREIESLIDRGQIDEAIAHCKHILREFPKHIETYRLLGKCYLESQRYIEATDILQRVLSVFPDDFISHIGMSIICEDENNLEKAIWHMERALEVQPSNSAVNSELRRLMTLRDGAEPSKVHLSQGAYIRMCVKSGLHEQAIAEAKSALSKEPQRVDLELILAKMYAELDQQSNATDQLTIILNKLPYCYEANLLMAQILKAANRSSEINSYYEKLVSIDPYFAFVNAEYPTPDLVLDDAVKVEQIEWQYSDDDTQRRTKILGVEWQDNKDLLASAGVTTKSFNQDSLPTELPEEGMIPSPEGIAMAELVGNVVNQANVADSQENTQEIAELKNESAREVEAIPAAVQKPAVQTPAVENIPQVAEESTKAPDSSQEIPDWMTAAGWVESNGENPEENSEASAKLEEVKSAEIPDWIKTLAPAEPVLTTGELRAESEKIDLLDRILPESDVTSGEASHEQPEGIQQAQGEPEKQAEEVITFESLGLVSAMREELQDTTPPSQSQPLPASEEVPDWLQSVKEAAEPATNQAEPAAVESTAPPLPVWMSVEDETEDQKLEFPDQKTLAAQSEGAATPSEGLPDWLAADQSAVSATQEPFRNTPSDSQPATAANIPDVFSEQANGNEASNPVWMNSDSISGAFGETPAEEEIPEWLREEEPEKPIPVETADEAIISSGYGSVVETPPANEKSNGEPDLSEVPDWLKEVNTDQSPVLSIPDEDILPDWAKQNPLPAEKAPLSADAVLETFIEQAIIPPAEISGSVPTPVASQPQEQLDAQEEPFKTAAVNESYGLDSLLDQLSMRGMNSSANNIEPVSQVVEPAIESNPSQENTSDQNSQLDNYPFAESPQEEIEEVRGDETLVSKPFVELEKEQIAKNISEEMPAKEPMPAPTPLEETTQKDAAFESLPSFDSDLGQLPGISEIYSEELFEASTLETAAPDDTLDVNTDNDIESWLNSLADVNPAPASEPASAPAGSPNFVAVNPIDFASPSPATATETQDVSPRFSPADTAPLGDLKDDNTQRDLSPLDELEEAGHFQNLPSVSDAMESIASPVVEEQPQIESVAGVTAEKLQTEPLVKKEAVQKTPETFEEMIDAANASLSEGNLDQAVTTYGHLIKKGSNIEEIVQNLRSAVYRYPSEVSIWQVLGDGYAKNNRLQEALDAYTKAEELLR